MTDKPPFDEDGAIPEPEVVYVRTQKIVVNKDRLRASLQDAVDDNRKQQGWQIPLGILVPIAGMLTTTSSFSARFGIGASWWGAIWVVSGFAVFAWLIRSLLRRGKPRTVDSIIEDLERDSNHVEIMVRHLGKELLAAPAREAPNKVQRRRTWFTIIACAWRSFFQFFLG